MAGRDLDWKGGVHPTVDVFRPPFHLEALVVAARPLLCLLDHIDVFTLAFFIFWSTLGFCRSWTVSMWILRWVVGWVMG